MICPHCDKPLTTEEIKRLWATYTAAQRQTLGGPAKQKRACQSCGMTCDSARGAWSHCRIPRDLEPEALLAHVMGRKPQALAALSGDYASLDALHDAVTSALASDLKPAQKKQALWYLGYVDRAMDKLESAA